MTILSTSLMQEPTLLQVHSSGTLRLPPPSFPLPQTRSPLNVDISNRRDHDFLSFVDINSGCEPSFCSDNVQKSPRTAAADQVSKVNHTGNVTTVVFLLPLVLTYPREVCSEIQI